MSPTMHMAAPSAMSAAPYTPQSDHLDRHEYGVHKNRKPASTGGGRAWSEDEEVYLLQTRLQKMPYKHIAAHLKKTELACRLHYHQLSHGSNRRKRTTSVSSGSSTGGHSPIMQQASGSMPSPIRESLSRSASPPGSAGSYTIGGRPGTPSVGIQLPSIMTGGRVANNDHSPRLPAILPKPASMTLAITSSPTGRGGYPEQHSAPLLPAASFTRTPPTSAGATTSHHHPSLRLDCTALPQMRATAPSSAPLAHVPVDMSRLNAVYSAHRSSFWATVANEYGGGANPASLETAWRQGGCCGAHGHHGQQQQYQTPAQYSHPITPVHSPEDRDAYPVHHVKVQSDKTRISAILGIDADPRSPKEREMVRRMEERVGA